MRYGSNVQRGRLRSATVLNRAELTWLLPTKNAENGMRCVIGSALSGRQFGAQKNTPSPRS